MTQLDSLVGFVDQPVQQVPLLGFAGNLLLALLMSFILARVYVSHGTALSNRRALAGNFVLIMLTTLFIISVVKSSLALSLGLVGALSIVRFRTAVKEPEELAYLFLAIAVGLGLGANQVVTTIVAFVFIVGFIYVRGMLRGQVDDSHLFLLLKTKRASTISLESIIDLLEKHCRSVVLKRYEEAEDGFEVLFVADFEQTQEFIACRDDLRQLDSTIDITIVDSRD